jgi:ribulose kinase
MNRIDSIHVAATTERKAEPGRFSTALRAAAAGAARGVAATVELAAPYVPGGTVLSAAVRSAAAPARGRLGVTAADPGTAAAGAAGAGSAASEGDILEATRALQQEAQTFNLQYLQLQESMQRESREFQALSNVMKVKHDSAKAAINNIH